MEVNEDAVWPMPFAHTRPWTRWWWLGNALDEAEITRHLTLFRDAGIGGVEVSPIYGVRGDESREVAFLSSRWAELFRFTLQEAARLGLEVDLIVGTGWPYGGPWVSDADNARRMWVTRFAPGRNSESDVDGATVLARQTTSDGTQHVLFLAPTGQQVKRAAPGGEGNVLDHFNREAVQRYLEPFTEVFGAFPERPRSFFNDSWEVFGANATPQILEAFETRCGYDLAEHLDALYGSDDTARRVRADFRETVSDLTREAFVGTWHRWARTLGVRSRNQAHGSPGNLLDLYGAVDIPETEMFGPTRVRFSGLEQLVPLTPDFGLQEELLICKMASSAAHVTGKPLCSSESFTWLGEHGHVPLEHMKAEVDLLLCLGINHIFFHGTPFSPEEVPWPGWLFYASTHCAPTNPFWRDLAALNAYITRCQSWMQAGIPDNDVLLYFPFSDLLNQDNGTHDLLHFLTVHKTGIWLGENLADFSQTARRLWKRGWTYDMVSDRQLTGAVRIEEGELKPVQGPGNWRVLLVAGCDIVPVETAQRWLTLAQEGATVLIVGDFPRDVPGLKDVEGRRDALAALWDGLGSGGDVAPGVRRFAIGSGCLLVGRDAEALLTVARVARETMTDAGLEFCRRQLPGTDAWVYFVSNPGQEAVDQWFSLRAEVTTIQLYDPMTGAVGSVATRPNDAGQEVRLCLPPGASLVMRTGKGVPGLSAWDYPEPDTAIAPLVLQERWDVAFLEGGPTLPEARTVGTLSSWTEWGDADLVAFSGTARYTTRFDLPVPGLHRNWRLMLGRVCHSARVRLNGQEIGTVLARPWEITLPATALKPGGNVLEVEVTNLMANRLADLERREGASWRPFLMVNIHYKPFDAATWQPVASGLIGPVRLVAQVEKKVA